ncbi:FxLYD domain-containing protein [Leptothoe sp. PORK10 BA2]|uniref:FxLYD domain-containing protein n=1 Tax=Leptothoe sp. PORK10 BA2 TaxID=3110254 RepID=UPI002B209393|nr:FxLYD domain-containing protein [Leptothoe sp. PORK10 BA2]MEA5462420.1 FxLYD domain-containing protein [Leptothoe sp. PORK10 BA2]
MGRDLIIEAYIQRLLEWKEPMTAESLKALAEEVGLGTDDMAAVEQKAQDHFERGRNYLDFDCLDEAIDELTQATALAPLHFESLQTLAYAYDQRYGKQKKAADKQQAIALAKRCLDIRPSDEGAVILISSLEHEANSRQRLIWLSLAAILGVVAFRPVMDIVTTRSAVEQAQETELAADPIAPPAESGPTEPAIAPPAEPGTTEPAIAPAADIPITFAQDGLTLDPRQSRLDNYKDSSYYTLQAVVQNTSKQEIDALQLQVEYLDSNGEILESESKEAIADNNATVRPGDYHAFDLIHKTTPDLAAVRLNVLTMDQLPAPDAYPQETPIPYEWVAPKAGQPTFSLGARAENLNSYDITDSAYFDAQWAVTNIGDSAIRQLKFQVNFYNLSGKLILSEDVLAVYGSDAPMLPGEVRPLRVITSIDKDYGRYEVMVSEVE